MSHCNYCANSPDHEPHKLVAHLMEMLDESIRRDVWFEISECSAFALREYIEDLRHKALSTTQP